ncbi:GNAT family N-acetyltransferase [Actinokineospora auranticolor]|uniref:Acetyltransferase (GNAT) family protein n=1 Tax=Actinokineospora auranticolor TaxID=155976 RepID=A0A2S6GBK4_9PSEU|nr:GNAT family N-acetyltransferase [Actinokineospora auranticolor]PPK61233.1 acetyltransferase (GNAT) family protein [Actinokineospora auranticolor]
MDTTAVRAAFDDQLRRHLPASDAGTVVQLTAALTRHLGSTPDYFSGVVWSDLDERTADAAIADAVAWFRSLDDGEWKYYGHDTPVDLPARLVAAGLRAGPAEAVMVAEAAEVPVFEPPAGVRLVDVRDPDDVDRVVVAHNRAFGAEFPRLGRRLREVLAQTPELLDLVVAVADGEPVCGARTEYVPGTDFATLWGGGTVPEWRGRGIYRALVSHRARLAEARGARYLQVDALPTSEPILRRVGFTRITTTTPYTL